MSHSLFPTEILSSKRDDYYDALSSADKGDYNELIKIVVIRELEVISRATALVHERKERSDWVSALAKRASDKKSGSLYKKYLVWSHRMAEVRAQFEYAATEISSASDVISVDHEAFEALDFNAWKEIIGNGYSTRSWFFSQTFRIECEKAFKYLLYFRRNRNASYDTFIHQNDIVSLFVTGGRYNDKYEFGGNLIDHDIRLREMLFADEGFMIYQAFDQNNNSSNSPAKSNITVESSTDINDTVRMFYEDVLVRKTGI